MLIVAVSNMKCRPSLGCNCKNLATKTLEKCPIQIHEFYFYILDAFSIKEMEKIKGTISLE